MRMAAAMVALTVLTIVFLFFDPVIEDNLYTDSINRVQDSRATTMLNKYLNSWHLWVAPFLLAIFIYMTTAGQEQQRITY